MANNIVTDRLKLYQINSIEDEENAYKEILQEIALYALSTTNFFNKAAFQGGTSLRILYQLPRFSEDLDFILLTPDNHFNWQPYIEAIVSGFKLFGIQPEITDRNKADKTIQKLFLKDNSIGKIINLNYNHFVKKKLIIKLEIDTNPPTKSGVETKYLDFPMDCGILTQDLPSNFAGKCHALLCRTYTKSRDWFDFSWYVTKTIPINFAFLTSAINQNGPWAGQGLVINKKWLTENLINKVDQIDWDHAKIEMQRFVNKDQQKSLNVWSSIFFKNKVAKLSEYL
jgi:predicted nucleotidyltransferase component of viral defense system